LGVEDEPGMGVDLGRTDYGHASGDGPGEGRREVEREHLGEGGLGGRRVQANTLRADWHHDLTHRRVRRQEEGALHLRPVPCGPRHLEGQGEEGDQDEFHGDGRDQRSLSAVTGQKEPSCL